MEAQLAFDAADRLVDLVEERRGPVAAEEAARALFALASAPAALAHSLLDDVVTGDARLAWRGRTVALANDPAEELPLEAASYVVVDLDFATVGEAAAFLTFLRDQVWAVPANSPALAGTPEAKILTPA